MANSTKRKWTKIKSFKGGHRFFREAGDSRVAIADDSGPTPDTTDDGILYLIGTGARGKFPTRFFLRVVDEEGEVATSPIDYREFVWAQEFMAEYNG